MRKALVLLISVLFLLSISSVFAGGKQETKPSAKPTVLQGAQPTSFKKIPVEPKVTIVFSGWGDQTEQKIYRDSIARFNKIYPQVKVDYQPIPADFQTKIKAMMAGGTAPDVFYVDDQLMTALGRTGQLLPLDSYMKEANVSRKDFITELLKIFTYKNKTYGLPKDWGTLGLVYLPEAFTAAGIPEPNDNWNWDNLFNAAKKIAKNTKFAGFIQNPDWARFAPWAFEAGGSYTNTDYTKATLDTPEIKKAASYILNMKKAGALVTSSDVGASWAGEAIGKKVVAMTYEGGWMVNFMRQNYPDVKWKAAKVVKGLNGVRSDVIFTNAIGVNANTKYPKASAAFTIFVTSRENQAEIVKTGFAYSTHPDQINLIKNPNDKEIASGGLVGKVAYWGPNTGKINDQVSKALERIYLGVQTVDQSFAQANKKVNEILSQGE